MDFLRFYQLIYYTAPILIIQLLIIRIYCPFYKYNSINNNTVFLFWSLHDYQHLTSIVITHLYLFRLSPMEYATCRAVSRPHVPFPVLEDSSCCTEQCPISPDTSEISKSHLKCLEEIFLSDLKTVTEKSIEAADCDSAKRKTLSIRNRVFWWCTNCVPYKLLYNNRNRHDRRRHPNQTPSWTKVRGL